MSIGQSVILWFLLLVGIILAAFGYMVDQGVSQEMDKTARVIAFEQLDNLSSIVSWDAAPESRYEQLDSFFDELSAITHVRAIRLYSWPSMELLHERGSASWLDGARREVLLEQLQEEHDWIGEAIHTDEIPCSLAAARYPALEGDHGAYMAVTATDRRTHNESLRELRWGVIGKCVWVLVLTVLAAWFMGRLIAKPLQDLAASVAEVEAGADVALGESTTFSELAYLRKTMATSYDNLRIAFERQARFTSDVSHELRTPVAAARTIAEVALLVPRPPEEYVAALQQVAISMERMTDIIEGLLILGRADAGRLELHAEELCLSSVLQQAILLTETEASEQDALIEVTCPDEATVQGDRRLLTLLVRNLLSNAIRYGPKGGRIGVFVERTGGRWEVVVEDHGPGIPVALRRHIFDRFARGDDHRTRKSGGSGLGLAIAGEIARVHGVTLVIEDAAAGGAGIRMQFPI